MVSGVSEEKKVAGEKGLRIQQLYRLREYSGIQRVALFLRSFGSNLQALSDRFGSLPCSLTGNPTLDLIESILVIRDETIIEVVDSDRIRSATRRKRHQRASR